MINLERAAAKAAEIAGKEPLAVLESLGNVLLISHDIPWTNGTNQDAVTLVNKTEKGLQYIVIYNRSADPFHLRFALARELGNIVLEHDGTEPEEVWSMEAECFAYHFLCHRMINYRPVRFCLSWEMKDSLTFGSIKELREFIAVEQTKYSRFIGRETSYRPEDITLVSNSDRSWRNGYDVVLEGRTIGYCGE